MNFLAHLYLPGNHAPLRIGGFLGDFVKGPLKGVYPADIERGISLHRKIDAWSDQQSALDAFKVLLPAEFNRYRGIIADVLCDHFLACHWSDYCKQPIEDFEQVCLHTLSSSQGIFPERAQWVLQRMQSGRWLTNYHHLGYCVGALERIGTRFKFANPLGQVEQPLNQNYLQFEQLCLQILSNLQINVAEWRAENTVN